MVVTVITLSFIFVLIVRHSRLPRRQRLRTVQFTLISVPDLPSIVVSLHQTQLNVDHIAFALAALLHPGFSHPLAADVRTPLNASMDHTRRCTYETDFLGRTLNIHRSGHWSRVRIAVTVASTRI